MYAGKSVGQIKMADGPLLVDNIQTGNPLSTTLDAISHSPFGRKI